MLSETEQIRQRILKAAAFLFTQNGYNGISMREIAEACQISKAGLYYYFADKEALLLAILETNLKKLGETLQQAIREDASSVDNLTSMVQSIFSQSPDDRAVIRLASNEIRHLSPEVRADFAQTYQDQFIGRLETVLERGCRSGEFRCINSRQATWILMGMMYPFFHPKRNSDDGEENGAVQLMLDIFLNGVQNDPTTRV